ncbi:MAG: hypothetical protein HY794_16670 [Desulfarculus sp.]|nr:hypothetical protein [Desulfarculus sp.]
MSLSQQFPELFALHGGAGSQPAAGLAGADAVPGSDAAWAGMLAAIPAGPGKAALLELLAIVAAHPVKVWGQQQEGSWVCGIEAEESWKDANAALWGKARGLWARALGVLAGHCQEHLPLQRVAAGPSRANPGAGQTTPGA